MDPIESALWEYHIYVHDSAHAERAWVFGRLLTSASTSQDPSRACSFFAVSFWTFAYNTLTSRTRSKCCTLRIMRCIYLFVLFCFKVSHSSISRGHAEFHGPIDEVMLLRTLLTPFSELSQSRILRCEHCSVSDILSNSHCFNIQGCFCHS